MLKRLSSIILTARYTLFAIFMFGCAGMQRSCASGCAENFGADWIIATYGMSGDVLGCWKLSNVSVTNEPHSDGIYWTGSGGHLVHISGWYNRVQVQGGDYEGAAKEIGIDLARCTGGHYLAKADTAPLAPSIPQEKRESKTGDGRVVTAAFDGGHEVRVVFGSHGVRELWVDGKSTSPTSETGRAALRAAGVDQ